MREYTGKSVSGGVAIGKLRIYKKSEQRVKRTKVSDVEAELERFSRAVQKASAQLQRLYAKALDEVGEANAAIFETHRMLIGDEDFIAAVKNVIEIQQVNAEYAVAVTGDKFSGVFGAMDSAYMQERAADIKDITERLIRVLSGKDKDGVELPEPVILLANDLAPSETVQLDKDKVLAFVTVQGAAGSHTAILARTMNIPALVKTNIAIDETINGALAIVDGTEGKIYVNPDAKTLARMKKKQHEEWENNQLFQSLRGKETVTLDGQKLMLYANIGNVKDLQAVIENDAEGIGLFRSEFIYLEKSDFPTEDEQFQIYKTVAETMADRRVIIRTLDIGADKQCKYFELENEANPAMGCRAIRICLTRPEIFKTQLRAIFRASVYGNIAIMYPMITGVNEIRQIQTVIEEVKRELTADGTAYGNPAQGIMIETPAAVMMSRELAVEVDFFSIGTNDLTQYTLAIDRQNEKLDTFYDAHHPAVLRMIRMVVENAHKEGIWVGICGELGADLSLTQEFLAMGVDELSVSPGSILPIRKRVRETNITEYKTGGKHNVP